MTESDAISGTWSPVWSTSEDEPTPAEDLRDVTLTFSDTECEVRRSDAVIRLGAYTTDPTTRPRTIDVRFHFSDVPELVDAPLRGIYERTGERLRICYGPPGGERASSFSAGNGTGRYLAEYRLASGRPTKLAD